MARLPRLCIPKTPHHIVQQVQYGQVLAQDAEDFERLRGCIERVAQREGVLIHAWLLVSQQVQLVLTPDTAEGLSRFVQHWGREQSSWMNRKLGRRGGLWQGRFRATVIQPGHWVLPTMIAQDRQVLQTGWLGDLGLYPWSSAGHYLGRRHDRWVVAPPDYWALGNTPFAREAAYAERLSQGLLPLQQRAIESAWMGGWPLGDAEFLAWCQGQTARRLLPKPRGRPKKAMNLDT